MSERVESALSAMDAAEQEIRGLEPIGHSEIVIRWGIARMRLIARDRATLERHVSEPERRMLHQTPHCDGCGRFWPCPDARALVDYWQEGA